MICSTFVLHPFKILFPLFRGSCWEADIHFMAYYNHVRLGVKPYGNAVLNPSCALLVGLAGTLGKMLIGFLLAVSEPFWSVFKVCKVPTLSELSEVDMLAVFITE